jgi:hypothetical protein
MGRPLAAKGQLDVVAKFEQPSLELDVATYIDPELQAPVGRIGLLGLASGSVRNSIALRGDEWGAFVDLWTKATRMQWRKYWRTVGTLTEKDNGDPSRLTILAGLGVKIVVISPKGAGMSYVIGKADVPRFTAAINQVRQILAAGAAP